MEFTAAGTVWVKNAKVEVEIEGSFYDVSKEDMRKIVEMRQAQGYSTLKEALHGATAKFKVVRGAKKLSLVEDSKTSSQLQESQSNNTEYATNVS